MSVKTGSNDGDGSNSSGLDDLDLNSAIEEVGVEWFKLYWQGLDFVGYFQIKLLNNNDNI